MIESKINNIFKTLLSIVKINILITYFKIINKKIIFFYHPRKNLTNIHTDYIEKLFKQSNKDIYIFYGHEVLNLNKKNYFFLKQGAIKYIYRVDIFLSNNVCDVFPLNAKNIYIHHDIYDSILINNTKEVELFKRIMKYDYLFLSNKKTILFFKNFLNKNKKNLRNINLPKIFETGYFKLDYLRNIIKKKEKLKIMLL